MLRYELLILLGRFDPLKYLRLQSYKTFEISISRYFDSQFTKYLLNNGDRRTNLDVGWPFLMGGFLGASVGVVWYSLW